jgi:3-methyladenine DNA glycosylase AlkD
VKLHPSHKEILKEIVNKSGKPTQHTFLASYLGNDHPRYPVSSPVLRKIAKEWATRNSAMPVNELRDVVSSLIHGKSFTEKCIAGILLGYVKPDQRKFDISIFDVWLGELQGWAEVDALCTGKFSLIEIPNNFNKWNRLLRKLSKDQQIEKRRASLVFFCSPISHCPEEELADAALSIVDSLKHEKEILITKAISWLLRSMIRHHRPKVEHYISVNRDFLPAIAVRETMIKLKTGKKGKSKKIS